MSARGPRAFCTGLPIARNSVMPSEARIREARIGVPETYPGSANAGFSRHHQIGGLQVLGVREPTASVIVISANLATIPTNQSCLDAERENPPARRP